MQIAVIGSGISGLSAAWLLGRRHEVTLYEADARLGGHAHTVDVEVDGIRGAVDTGFLVFNHRTYPELTALFDHLGVATAKSEMSFSVRLHEEGLEWAGTNLAALFAQPRNLLRRGFWRMLRDISRFNRMATTVARGGAEPGLTVGGFLLRYDFSREFRDWYLLPMAGAIWSTPTAGMLDYPLASFARFCANHGLLQLADRPQWHTVTGGSREYVQRLAEGIGEVRCADPVKALLRTGSRVELASEHGPTRRFDAVVLACHPDQALGLLVDAGDRERAVLGAVPYQPNRAVLHTDTRLLPAERSAWAAWNYHAAGGPPDARPVGVSYWLNRLQPLPFTRPVIVSLNPDEAIDPSHVLGEYTYAHPVFDFGALTAQRGLADLQGHRKTWYCGAWTGYGFHEDGLASALRVADAMGCRAPWHAMRRAA